MGHLAHRAQTRRYESFSGRIGKSEISGTLQVYTGGKRPILHRDLVFQQLDLDDLGPVIGVKRAGHVATAQLPTRQSDEYKDQRAPQSAPARATGASSRVLPDIPFSHRPLGRRNCPGYCQSASCAPSSGRNRTGHG